MEILFQIMLSYAFIPLAFLIGIEWSEVYKVSRLLGMKVMFNEVLAYLDLGEEIRNNNISVSISYCVKWSCTVIC